MRPKIRRKLERQKRRETMYGGINRADNPIWRTTTRRGDAVQFLEFLKNAVVSDIYPDYLIGSSEFKDSWDSIMGLGDEARVL